MPNYCTKAQAAAIAQTQEGNIRQEWLDWVDYMIEQYNNSQGYKGAVREIARMGEGTSLIKLPSRAASITSIIENDTTTLSASEYLHRPGSKLIERLNTLYVPGARRSGYWTKEYEYLIEYVEPTVVRKDYELAAAQAVAIVWMFTEKYGDVGVALTVSEYAGVGKVERSGSTSYPAMMVQEINKAIESTVRKSGFA
jgi:hypothetical protein